MQRRVWLVFTNWTGLVRRAPALQHTVDAKQEVFA